MIEPDVGQVLKSRGGGIEQCTQNPRSCLLEFAPELRLIAAYLGPQFEELHDECAIQKVGPRASQVGNRIEYQRTGGTPVMTLGPLGIIATRRLTGDSQPSKDDCRLKRSPERRGLPAHRGLTCILVIGPQRD
jgi:hypothetical protein